jgi:hypothetical protein
MFSVPTERYSLVKIMRNHGSKSIARVRTSNSVDTIPKGHSPRTISATVGQCKQPGVTDIRWKEILNWDRLYERWISYPVDKYIVSHTERTYVFNSDKIVDFLGLSCLWIVPCFLYFNLINIRMPPKKKKAKRIKWFKPGNGWSDCCGWEFCYGDLSVWFGRLARSASKSTVW